MPSAWLGAVGEPFARSRGTSAPRKEFPRIYPREASKLCLPLRAGVVLVRNGVKEMVLLPISRIGGYGIDIPSEKT